MQPDKFHFYQKRGALMMKHSGYLTTSGAEIYYEQYGSGTPLLILHGNSQSLAVFYPFLRTFLPDFQVILMDSRGHGRSRLSVHTALHGFSTEDMADDVIALLNHLHLSSVHLLGFSDGANIGLEIACKYPERLKTLICISANASHGRAAHAAAPCRPNATQHFKSPGESPAACFKMQLLLCLCILQIPLWSLHCPPRKFPCHFRRISLFPPHPQFVPTKKGNAISGQFFPGFRQNKKEA